MFSDKIFIKIMFLSVFVCKGLVIEGDIKCVIKIDILNL